MSRSRRLTYQEYLEEQKEVESREKYWEKFFANAKKIPKEIFQVKWQQ